MDSIVLTEFGETLNPYSGTDKHGTTDETVLVSSCWGERTYDKDVVGVHYICYGTIQLKRVSKAHNALCCNHCGLRIVIPVEVDDYGKLRAWFESDLAKEQQKDRLKTLGGEA